MMGDSFAFLGGFSFATLVSLLLLYGSYDLIYANIEEKSTFFFLKSFVTKENAK